MNPDKPLASLPGPGLRRRPRVRTSRALPCDALGRMAQGRPPAEVHVRVEVRRVQRASLARAEYLDLREVRRSSWATVSDDSGWVTASESEASCSA